MSNLQPVPQKPPVITKPEVKKPYKAFGTYAQVMKTLNQPADRLVSTPNDLQQTILKSYVTQIERKVYEANTNLVQTMQEIERNLEGWKNRKDVEAKGYLQLYSDQLARLKPIAEDRLKEREALEKEIKTLIGTQDQMFATLANKSPAEVKTLFTNMRNKADELNVKLNGLIEREKAVHYDLTALQRQSKPIGQEVATEMAARPHPSA